MKTSKRDYERFKAEFRRWQLLLGLTDTKVYFEHGHCDKAYATIYWDCEGRVATVTFADKLSGDGVMIGYDPISAGRHEALEMLVARLDSIAKSRYCFPDDIAEEKHAIIRRLEHLFDALPTTNK
jgi:hypothetical protein